jgi:hypothetical protein
VPSCCNDPVVWKAGGQWYAVTAAHGNGGQDFGYETYYTSPQLIGAGAHWRPLPPFFENKASQLIPGHPEPHEFVSPDYFDAIPNAPSANTSVFMTSTYGPFGNVSGVPRSVRALCFVLANYFMCATEARGYGIGSVPLST